MRGWRRGQASPWCLRTRSGLCVQYRMCVCTEPLNPRNRGSWSPRSRRMWKRGSSRRSGGAGDGAGNSGHPRTRTAASTRGPATGSFLSHGLPFTRDDSAGTLPPPGVLGRVPASVRFRTASAHGRRHHAQGMVRKGLRPYLPFGPGRPAPVAGREFRVRSVRQRPAPPVGLQPRIAYTRHPRGNQPWVRSPPDGARPYTPACARVRPGRPTSRRGRFQHDSYRRPRLRRLPDTVIQVRAGVDNEIGSMSAMFRENTGDSGPESVTCPWPPGR